MSGIISLLERTMLIERLLGVGAYALLVALVYLLLSRTYSYRSVNRILNVALVVLCVLAFFFVPDESKDLYRLREMGELWKDYTLGEFLSSGILSSTTPLSYVLIYLCTQTGIGGFLPMISAFVFYTNVFYILKDVYRNTNISSRMLALDFLFFMSAGAFLEVISGVRCFMALSIVARCIYDEMVRGKSVLRSIPLYVIACLLHLSCIPVVAIRVLFLLFLEKKRSVTHLAISSLSVMLVGFLAIRYGQGLIGNMLEKANEYLSSESYSYVWEYVIGFIQWGVIVGVLIGSRHMREQDIGLTNLTKFMRLFLAVNMLFFFEYSIFHRFLVISAMLFIPFLASVREDESPRFNALRRCILLGGILILILACVRGNLCGYKFFELF